MTKERVASLGSSSSQALFDANGTTTAVWPLAAASTSGAANASQASLAVLSVACGSVIVLLVAYILYLQRAHWKSFKSKENAGTVPKVPKDDLVRRLNALEKGLDHPEPKPHQSAVLTPLSISETHFGRHKLLEDGVMATPIAPSASPQPLSPKVSPDPLSPGDLAGPMGVRLYEMDRRDWTDPSQAPSKSDSRFCHWRGSAAVPLPHDDDIESCSSPITPALFHSIHATPASLAFDTPHVLGGTFEQRLEDETSSIAHHPTAETMNKTLDEMHEDLERSYGAFCSMVETGAFDVPKTFRTEVVAPVPGLEAFSPCASAFQRSPSAFGEEEGDGLDMDEEEARAFDARFLSFLFGDLKRRSVRNGPSRQSTVDFLPGFGGGDAEDYGDLTIDAVDASSEEDERQSTTVRDDATVVEECSPDSSPTPSPFATSSILPAKSAAKEPPIDNVLLGPPTIHPPPILAPPPLVSRSVRGYLRLPQHVLRSPTGPDGFGFGRSASGQTGRWNDASSESRVDGELPRSRPPNYSLPPLPVYPVLPAELDPIYPYEGTPASSEASFPVSELPYLSLLVGEKGERERLVYGLKKRLFKTSSFPFWRHRGLGLKIEPTPSPLDDTMMPVDSTPTTKTNGDGISPHRRKSADMFVIGEEDSDSGPSQKTA